MSRARDTAEFTLLKQLIDIGCRLALPATPASGIRSMTSTSPNNA